MPLQRALLVTFAIVAVTAAAAAPLTDSMASARRGLKDTANELNLRGSISKAVRGALKRAATLSHRPQDRMLISLPGQSQTVCTCLPMALRLQHGMCSQSPMSENLQPDKVRQHRSESLCSQGDHPIVPGPLAPPVDFAQAGTETQTVNYAALPNPTTLPNPITICPDGVPLVVATLTVPCEGLADSGDYAQPEPEASMSEPLMCRPQLVYRRQAAGAERHQLVWLRGAVAC